MAARVRQKSYAEIAADAVFASPRRDKRAVRRLLRAAMDRPRMRVVFCGDPSEYASRQGPGSHITSIPQSFPDSELTTPFGTADVDELAIQDDDEARLRPFQAVDQLTVEHFRKLNRSKEGDILVSEPNTVFRHSINALSVLSSENYPLLCLDLRSVYGDIDELPLAYELLLAGCMACFVQNNIAYCLMMPKIKWIDRQLIHCPDGPAVTWESGHKEYYWRGLKVPDYFITRRNRLSIAGILKIDNAEYRRCYLEIIGQDRLLKSEHVRKIHEDRYGELYNFEMYPKDSDDVYAVDPAVARFVRVVNGTPNPDGSKKHYFLWVPDTVVTAHQAVAWTYGMTTSEYCPDSRT